MLRLVQFERRFKRRLRCQARPKLPLLLVDFG
jgi:hypothetical protein